MPEDGDQYVGLCIVYAKKLLLYEADLYNSQWNTQGFYFQPYPWENKNSLVSEWSVSGNLSQTAVGWFFIRDGLGLNHFILPEEGSSATACLPTYPTGLFGVTPNFHESGVM